MDCPVCYTQKAECKLLCGHSFCYQCLCHWYQEYNKHTCPMCRQDISFMIGGETREVHIQCIKDTSIDNYIHFYKLLDKIKNKNITLKDVEYLRRQKWVKWVIEHKAKNQEYTKYTFYGLQGTEQAHYQERQKSQGIDILSKAYKD